MRGGGGGEGELGTISSELVLWVSTAAERGGVGGTEREGNVRPLCIRESSL